MQAAGGALINSVKEACLVNFEYRDVVYDGSRTGKPVRFRFTATCKAMSPSRTVVLVNTARTDAGAWLENRLAGHKENRMLQTFWADMDSNLVMLKNAASMSGNGPAAAHSR